jgi:hypothetical protein
MKSCTITAAAMATSRYLAFLVLFVLVATLPSCSSQEQSFDCSFDGEIPLPDAGLTLRQIIHPAVQTVTVQLTYPGQGWLSLGFSNTGMVGATTVVGLPVEGTVEKYLMTAKVPSAVNPTSVNPTLTDASIVQTDTETILTYTKPLVEPGELAVSPDEPNTIIWAVGSSNEWGSFHFSASSFTLSFDSCRETTTPSNGETDVTEDTTLSTPSVTAEDLDCALYSQVDILPGLLSLKHVTNPIDETVTMEMIYEGQGYLGIAFTTNGFMVGHTAIMALPSSGENANPPSVAKYFLGGKNPSAVRLVQDDDRQTLTDTMVLQNDTHTIMRFTKPLEEPGELAVSVDGVNRMIFAVGENNNLGWHTEFGAFDLTLASCIPVGSTPPNDEGAQVADLFNDKVPNENLWRIHGIFMATAWGALIPLGIGASLARNLFPDGLWFVIHRGLNGLALLFNIAGFAIAVYCISDSPGVKHFQDETHYVVGLIVFVVAMLQGIAAMFRPSLHKTDTNSSSGKDIANTHHGTSEELQTPSTNDDSNSHGKTTLRTIWEVKHRLVGVALLGLAWYNLQSGVELFDQRFGDDYTLAVWILVGVVAGIVGISTLMSKSRKN